MSNEQANLPEAARILDDLLALAVGATATLNHNVVLRDDADGLETWVVGGRRLGYIEAVEWVTGRTTEELAAWFRRAR